MSRMQKAMGVAVAARAVVVGPAEMAVAAGRMVAVAARAVVAGPAGVAPTVAAALTVTKAESG